MKRVRRIKDWRKVEPRTFFGERFTPDYLSERRQDLETIVAGFLTSAKTGHVIEFQGKRRYLVSDPRRMDWVVRPACEACAKPAFAVVALQYLYRLERARAAGDADQTIILTIAFTRADAEVQNLWYRNMDSYGAFATVRESKEKRQKTRLGKTELRDVRDVLLESIVGNHKRSRKRNWLQLATDEINRQCGTDVDAVTVRREMKRRGIWDTSTKVTVASKTKVHLSA